MDVLKNRHDIDPILTKEIGTEEKPLNQELQNEDNTTERDKNVIKAEDKLYDITFGIFSVILIISIFCFFIGLNGTSDLNHEEETMLMGTGLFVGILDIIFFIIAMPLTMILIGISRNLREINSKLK